MKTLSVYALLLISFSLSAQWNANTIINAPVAIADKGQDNVHTVTDTKGGVVVSWDDKRTFTVTATDIYAQRIKKNGHEKWLNNGIAICTYTGTQKSSALISSGIDGSAIITWEDNRAGNFDIYAQKVDSSGNVLWTTNGIAVCSKTTNQKNPKISSDNAGGAIIVWEDSLNNYWDISAQRISSTGTLLWTTNGVNICNSPNAQNNPKIDVDGLGGAIITWQDKRNNADYDIYAQRIDNSGASLWTANGVVVCNAINTQNNPRIEPDGANGALIGWTDKRNAIDNNIYAQRVNAAGAVQWTANGVLVCGATNNQSALDIKYIGTAGLMLTWKDDRTTVNFNAIYAQIVSLAGANQLASNGILISNGIKSINPNVINDGTGGAILAWQDSTALGWDIKTQSINSTGVVQWTSGGVTVCNASDDQENVAQVTDGAGGAIYVWEDRRNTSNYDLYAHHLYSTGTPILIGINELAGLNEMQSFCFPNPVTAQSVIELKNNTANHPWEISIFDGTGKLIQIHNLKGNESYVLNSVDYAAGIYFYVISIKETSSYSKGSFISVNRN
ncbi:MAG: T9SS type A sorting domain-containing protein [Bacteroidota bacterium]